MIDLAEIRQQRRPAAEVRSRPGSSLEQLPRPLQPAKWAVIASIALIVAALASGQA